MLGRYWHLARSQCAGYAVLVNNLGQFLANKGSLLVPKVSVPMVLHDFHDVCGHFGVNRAYEMIDEQYYWPCMGDDIRRHCQRCDICQRNQSNTHKLASLY